MTVNSYTVKQSVKEIKERRYHIDEFSQRVIGLHYREIGYLQARCHIISVSFVSK